MTRRLFAAALLAVSASAMPASAAPVTAADVAPLLTAPDRSEGDRVLDPLRNPAKAIAFMNLETGDRVLDVFSGTGYYSELIGKLVGPEGFVLAHNPEAFAARDTISSGVAARGYGVRLPNVASINRGFDQLKLAPNSLDEALFHLVYHDLYFENPEMGLPRAAPQLLLAQINTALRPGGTVTVIDHVGVNADDPRAEVQAVHRIAPERVIRDFRQAGFDLVARETFFENPEDDPSKSVFDPPVRGKTDRFALRFAKTGDPNATFLDAEAAATPGDNAAETCDAAAASAFVGQIYEEALKARIVQAAGGRTARVYDTNSAVTMDFRPDRVNIVTDPDSGEILEVKCG